MRIEVRWRSWHGDSPLTLEFPAQFAVSLHPPRDGADIGPEGVVRAFAAPIGTPRIRDLAQGRKNAVIVVDDIARPTPAPRRVPMAGGCRRLAPRTFWSGPGAKGS